MAREVKYYANKRNPNKRLMVRHYYCGHYYVLPFMSFGNGVVNKLGDGKFHRWRKKNLKQLLDDYEEVK